MRVVIFCHSLVSDWNHGNAHFLRGIAGELLDRDFDLRIFEPENGWSRRHLVRDHGRSAIARFHQAYPRLRSEPFLVRSLDLDDALAGADLVLVHEWSEHDLVRRIGQHHREHPGYVLLFHDTHHRSITDPDTMAAYDLSEYDGVLAFGDAIRDRYLERGWARQAWTWHEAADARMFHPRESDEIAGDVVWVGNWGDDERTAEIEEFLLTPVKRLGLKATVCGVRYPAEALDRLAADGVEYRGWLPNYLVPQLFSRFKVTVHIPRRPYVHALPGIPTIRPFEAMACGLPLISARWSDTGGLFTAGEDFLVADDGREMTSHLSTLMNDDRRRRELAARGRATVLSRHTCGHRVDELMTICNSVHQNRFATL
jgi:spore maturation protein CgeB